MTGRANKETALECLVDVLLGIYNIRKAFVLTSSFIIIIVLLVTFRIYCSPSHQKIIEGLQSDEPDRVVEAYEAFLNDEDRDISLLFHLDTGSFCRHGLQLVHEIGSGVLPELQNQLTSTNDLEEKKKIIVCFGVVGELDAHSLELLNDEYRQGNDDIKVLICRVWESVNPPNSLVQDSIIDGLNSTDAAVRAGSALVIARIAGPQDTEYLPKLISIWEDERITMIKLPVAAALYNLGWEQENMLNYMIETTDNNGAFVQVGLRALSKIPGVDIVAEFRKLLFESNDSLVTMSAIQCIAEYEPVPDIVLILTECLDTGDTELQRMALIKLGLLGPDARSAVDEIEELIEISGNRDVLGIENAANFALDWITKDKIYTFRYWGSYFDAFIYF